MINVRKLNLEQIGFGFGQYGKSEAEVNTWSKRISVNGFRFWTSELEGFRMDFQTGRNLPVNYNQLIMSVNPPGTGFSCLSPVW